MNRLENSTSRQQLVGYLKAWARSLLFPFIPVTKTPIQNCLLKYCSHIQEIWFSFLCQKNSIYSLKQALRAFQSAVHGALDTGDEKSQVRLTFKVEGDKGTHQLINLQHAIPLNGFRSSNSYYLSFLYLCCPNCGWLYRARNNFGTVVGHDNQLKKLLLSWVSFLTCPNIQIGKKRFTFMRNFLSVSMIVFLQRKSKIYRREDLVIFSSMRVAWLVNDQRVKFLAGQATFLAWHCPLTGRYFEPFFY